MIIVKQILWNIINLLPSCGITTNFLLTLQTVMAMTTTSKDSTENIGQLFAPGQNHSSPDNDLLASTDDGLGNETPNFLENNSTSVTLLTRNCSSTGSTSDSKMVNSSRNFRCRTNHNKLCFEFTIHFTNTV